MSDNIYNSDELDKIFRVIKGEDKLASDGAKLALTYAYLKYANKDDEAERRAKIDAAWKRAESKCGIDGDDHTYTKWKRAGSATPAAECVCDKCGEQTYRPY